MKARFHILATATAVFLAVSSSAAFANDHHKIQAVSQTKISPSQAIAAAKKQADGQPIELQLNNKYGHPTYEVEIRNGNQEHTIYIDGVNGQMVGNKTETEHKPFQKTSISLEQAIQIAQGQVAGQIMEAERDVSRGQTIYQIEIFTADNIPHKVVIDAENGKVLASHVDYDD